MKLRRKNYFKTFPPKQHKRLLKVMLVLKGVCGTLSGAALINKRPIVALGVMVLGAILDEAIKFTTPTVEPVIVGEGQEQKIVPSDTIKAV